ncbi:MAG: LysM domain [Verrucomicrobiota bacterium]|jgi:LysM repeat protein
MKRFLILLVVMLSVGFVAQAQDAATQEQLNKLRAEIESLQESNKSLQNRLSDVLKELQEVRAQASKPQGDYASSSDVKQLAEKIRELDQKRKDDVELISKQIKNLGKTLASPGGTKTAVKVPETPKSGDKPAGPEKGIEYIVKPGDTLSAIAKSCTDQGVKVTVDDILKANPGLKATNLKVDQKIFIPASTK